MGFYAIVGAARRQGIAFSFDQILIDQSPRIRVRLGTRPSLPEWPILSLLCPWKRIWEQTYEAAIQRSKRETGNHEPHSDRGRTKKDRTDRRTRTPSGPIGTGIGDCARSN